MYDFIKDGAISERAFIGALATAITKNDNTSLRNLFSVVTEPNIIFSEGATIILYDAYKKSFDNGTITAYSPVEISGGRSEVRQIIDECIKTFNAYSSAEPDHKAFFNMVKEEYRKNKLSVLYEKLTDRVRFGTDAEVDTIKKEIADVEQDTGNAAERLAKHNNINLLSYFVERDPATMRRPIKTPYPTLNKYTNGGLRDELYIINAGTSVGKTAFAMQICDYVAKEQPVIVFALEMGQTELMARSISRETYEFSKQNYNNTNFARTQNDILDFDRYYYNEEQPEQRVFNKEEIAVVDQAITNYKKYLHNIYTITPDGELTINDIKKAVSDFYYIYEDYNKIQLQQKHPKPIYPFVVVDYLQLIAPTNEHMDERRTTDECIIGLKQIARDYKATVICLSATARSNYNKEQTIDGGKNSGGIEYTAGTVFGLQFYAQGFDVLGKRVTQYGTEKYIFDKGNTDVEIEKARDPRYMELKVLKNRSGMVQSKDDRIILEYNAKYHHYAELGKDQHEPIAKKIQRDYADRIAEILKIDIPDNMAFGIIPFSKSECKGTDEQPDVNTLTENDIFGDQIDF